MKDIVEYIEDLIYHYDLASFGNWLLNYDKDDGPPGPGISLFLGQEHDGNVSWFRRQLKYIHDYGFSRDRLEANLLYWPDYKDDVLKAYDNIHSKDSD